MSFENILSIEGGVDYHYMQFLSIQSVSNFRAVCQITKSRVDEYLKFFLEKNDILREVEADLAPRVLRNSITSFVRHLTPQAREELASFYQEAAAQERAHESKKISLILKNIYSVVKSAGKVFDFTIHNLGTEETIQKYSKIIWNLSDFEEELGVAFENEQLRILEEEDPEGNIIFKDFLEVSIINAFETYNIDFIQKITTLTLLNEELFGRCLNPERELICLLAAQNDHPTIIEAFITSGKMSNSAANKAIKRA